MTITTKVTFFVLIILALITYKVFKMITFLIDEREDLIKFLIKSYEEKKQKT
jgi:F0F1-type ATP synthase membrane subunit b/b'